MHALSFDIEDWFHIVEVAAVEDPSSWTRLHDQSSVVDSYTDLILRVCDDAGVKATFFMLGWVAERHPELVKRIADEGHELGAHSYWHRKVYEMSRGEFEEDMRRCLDVVEGASGQRVLGFRAPSFSIKEGSEWALDALLDLGFAYDASLFPASRGHGGYMCPQGAHVVTTPSGRELPELPMSIATFGAGPMKKKLCYSGGGYMRVLPGPVIEHGLRQEASAGRPTVVYLHPRDFAPDVPRVKMPPHRRFKCYTGMRSTEGKLRRLLSEHQWGTCKDVLERELGRSIEPLVERPLMTGAQASGAQTS